MDDLLASLVAAGIISPDTAATLRRQLDPVALREWAEATLFGRAVGAFQGQQRRFLDMVRGSSNAPTAATVDRFWDGENERLFDDLVPALRELAVEGAASVAWRSGVSDGVDALQLGVVDWVDRYYLDTNPNTFGSVYQLNRTGQTRTAAAFGQWKRGQLRDLRTGESPLAPLIEELQGAFGPLRAEAVVPTEVTRIFTEAGRQAEEGNSAVSGFVLLTAADERVCPICGPLHGQQRPKGNRYYIHPTLGRMEGPPFHVRCRCDESPVTAISGAQPRPREDTFVFAGVTQ